MTNCKRLELAVRLYLTYRRANHSQCWEDCLKGVEVAQQLRRSKSSNPGKICILCKALGENLA